MRVLFVVAALAIAAPAYAEDGVPDGWSCKQFFEGGPRVCGSNHSTYTPPQIITRTETVDVPVPVPVYSPPTVIGEPYPVFVGRHREARRHEPRRMQLLPNH